MYFETATVVFFDQFITHSTKSKNYWSARKFSDFIEKFLNFKTLIFGVFTQVAYALETQ